MSLSECPTPCWVAVCDRCGEGDNGEDGGSFHHESKATALASVRDQDWLVSEDDELLCFECAEEMIAQLPCPHVHDGRCPMEAHDAKS